MFSSMISPSHEKKHGRCAVSWAGAFVALLAVLCFSAPAALGQCTLSSPDTWTDGNGNWSNGGNWSGGEPNSSSTNVCITDGTSAVTLDTNASVADLQLASGNALNFNGGTELLVYGTQIINAGQINVNGGGGTNTYLYLGNSVTLSGGGTLALSTTTTGGGGNAYLWQNGAYALDNVDNTIEGEGYIYNSGATIINEAGGKIIANSTGSPLINTLEIDYGNITNKGLLEATNSGVLQLFDNTINNAGGNITASGANATVNVYESTIQGGTLNTNSGGTMQSAGYAYLDGSTVSGAINLSTGSTYTTAGGNETFVLGTINNQGNFQVNGGGGTNAYLYTNDSITLQGGGTVTLSTTTTGGAGNAWLWQNGAYTLDNVDNTIQGEGYIYNNGATIINEASGKIIANSTGSPLINTLEIEYGNITNQGLLEATNSGVLQLFDNTINNAGANITASGANATVNIYESTIQGGTLNNNTGGTMQTVGYAYLDGSTVSGAINLSTGSTYTTAGGNETFVLGTINNQGNFQVNGGGGANAYLYTNANTTLQGGGTVTLNTTSGGGGGNAYLSQNGGWTLDIVNNTIQGEGIIYNNGATITNEALGTINANSTGGSLIPQLEIEYGNITNSGLLEATNSGILQLFENTINNAGANITASGPNATVQVYNTTIQGGTLNNNTGGTMQTIGTSLLDGSTASGAINLSSGSTYSTSTGYVTEVLGTLNNQGNFQVNGGGGYNTYMYTVGNTTLQGGGTLTLNQTTAGGGGVAELYQDGGWTLDNVNNTIQGEGFIYNNGAILINESSGKIIANSTGSPLVSTLEIDYGTVNNTGLLEATNSGVLQLFGTVINNAGGGQITASGPNATVNVWASTIQGGTLNNNTGGTMQTVGTSVLDGSTASGAINLSSGSTYTTAGGNLTEVLGTINNQGNFQVNGGGGYNTHMYTIGNTTLQGGGTLTLNQTTAGGGGVAQLYQTGANTLDNVNNTIQGEGYVYNNGATIINEAGGTIIANSTGSPLTTTLEIEYGTVTNNGTLQANSGNLLHLLGGSLTNFSGNTLTGGTYNVYGTLLSPGTLQIDSLGNTGGEIVNNAATILLDGPNSNFVDAAGLDALSQFSNNTATGSFTIQNGRNFTSPGDFANAGTVTVGTATGDTSTFKMGSGGASAYTQSGGMTQGTGTIAGAVAINGGTIQPGLPNTPGTLSITGSYSQTGGTFGELIAGAGAGQFGVLNISGASSLGAGANLGVSLLNSFTPTTGETFTIANFASNSGTFANAPSGPSGFALGGEVWTIAYNSNDIVLDAVLPENTNVTATWNTPTGNWTTATEWSCTPGPANCVPNNGTPVTTTYSATLDSPGNTLTLDSTSNPTNITVNSATVTAGTLSIGTGASLTVTGDAPIATGAFLNMNGGTLTVGGTLTNNGGVIGTSFGLTGFGTINGTGTFNNVSTVDAIGGTLDLSGINVANYNAGTLTGGGWYADAPLKLPGDIVTNSAFIFVDLGGSVLDAVGNNALATLTSNQNGLLDAGIGGSVSTSGNFTNNNSSQLLATYDGSKLTVNGNLTNSNNSTVQAVGSNGGATIDVTGNLSNASTSIVEAQNGGTLLVGGSVTNEGQIITGNAVNDTGNNVVKISGALSNSGTITLEGTGDSLTADLTNTGSIGLTGNNETLTDTGDFNNNSPGSLSLTAISDQVKVSGAFYNNAGASVTMSGTDGSLSAAIAFINGGAVTLSGSGDILSTPSFSSTGTVSIGGNETVDVTGGGTYTQTGGSTKVNGTLTAGGVSLQGGSLLGAGRINGNLNNSGGSVEPASASGVAGTLTLNGSYTQGSGGTLIVDLGPTFPAQSFFDVFTDVSLGGTVDFKAVGGFTPTTGEDFTFLEWGGTESGNFTNIEFTNWSCPAGDTCTDVFGTNTLTLEINPQGGQTPEPSAVILLGTALLAMAAYGIMQRRSAKHA